MDASYKFKLKLVLVMVLFGCILPVTIQHILEVYVLPWWLKLVAVLLVATFGSISLAFVRLLMHRTTPHQSLKKLLLHFIVSVSSSYKARSMLPKFRETLKRPGYYQERILLQILKDNKDTVYGEDFGLARLKDIDDFRSKHPLTKYEHYRPYVQRMMDGEEKVLTAARPKSFTRTSGTTGQPKYFPILDRQSLLTDIASMVTGLLQETVPGLGPLQKRLQYYVHPVTSRSKAGIPIETALTFPADNAFLMSLFNTPPSGFTITTKYEANYIHLLFALKDKYIGIIGCNFLSLLEVLILQLENCWQDIVDDIERTIRSSLNLDSGVRDQISLQLKGKGDPNRAKELRTEFRKGFQDIVPRVWPHAKIIMGVDPQDVRFRLARKYTGDIPTYSYVIGASEGFLGMNMWPLDKKLGYVPSFLHNFYEFIPVSEIDDAEPTTLLPEELQVGECYEMVITQTSGLYRYRMGDVLRVTRFEQATPVFEFSHRKGQMLNLYYEKIDQKMFYDSLKIAVNQWSDTELTNYAVAESSLLDTSDQGSASPYYIIFIELAGSGTVDEKQRGMIDTELRDRCCDYEKLRSDNTIAPPRIHVLRPGAFNELQDYSVTKGGASEIQYKVPNKLLKVEQYDVLMGQVDRPITSDESDC
nr:LOW QUALITY PROTEIN: uncharacterized protein LOC129271650 [Lytechinus pictus]